MTSPSCANSNACAAILLPTFPTNSGHRSPRFRVLRKRFLAAPSTIRKIASTSSKSSSSTPGVSRASRKTCSCYRKWTPTGSSWRFAVSAFPNSSNIILEHSRRLARLTEDLLMLSKMDADRLELEIRRLSVSQFVESCIETTQRPAAEKDLRISVNLQQHLPDIAADRRRLADRKSTRLNSSH